MERLQKILAHAGVGSRRECERLIAQGVVTVNGQRVTEIGTKVDPEECAIKVHGKLLQLTPTKKTYQYLLLHKPKGYLTTMKADPEGRLTLLDLLPKKRIKARVYPVGRLDYNSEGLVLLTNDGELAYRLMHPKYKVSKTYQVKVHGIPSPKVLRILSQGVYLEDGRTAPAKVKIVKTTGKNAWLLFTIYEGKKRQIRRMCEKVRFPVLKLKRTILGPMTLTDLEPGHFRHLSGEEVQILKHAVKLR
jgi:pseudouridine synthase